jgi:hypothetical protein
MPCPPCFIKTEHEDYTTYELNRHYNNNNVERPQRPTSNPLLDKRPASIGSSFAARVKVSVDVWRRSAPFSGAGVAKTSEPSDGDHQRGVRPRGQGSQPQVCGRVVSASPYHASMLARPCGAMQQQPCLGSIPTWLSAPCPHCHVASSACRFNCSGCCWLFATCMLVHYTACFKEYSSSHCP